MASEKNGKPTRSPLGFPEISKATKNSIQLARRYHSGELEAWRKAAISSGSSEPWRILRYERIIDPEKATLPLSRFSFVTPATFRKHLKTLKRTANILPVEELVTSLLYNQSLPDNTVAITIDGGWMDTFLYAAPIIEEENVPVAVFVPTAFIGTNELFWRDRVALALLEMQKAGMTLEPFEFFDEDIKKSFPEVCPEGQINLPGIFLMIEGLRRTNELQRQVAIGFLGEMYDSLGGGMPLNPSFLSWNEIRIMDQLGMRFGPLGHRNISYRDRPLEEIREDLRMSLISLENQIENPLLLHAAPEGDFSGESLSVYEEFSIQAALLEDFTPAGLGTEKTLILRRICPYQELTFSPELFFAMLWDLPIG